MKKNKIAVVIGLCLLFIGTYTVGAKSDKDSHPKRHPKVRVATWNVYIGTDLFAVLGGYLSVDDAISEIVESNFPARAKAIAKKLISNSPDLIGFQEAWRIEINLPGFTFPTWFPDPTAVDYEEILTSELEKLGYKHVETNELTNITLPILADETLVGSITIIDRDIIFAKNEVNIIETYEKDYDDTFKAMLFDLIPIESKRGYVEALVEIHGREYLFVNTHLEDKDIPAVSPYGVILGEAQELQAEELADHLVNEFPGETRPIILVGDLNAWPDDEVTMIMEGAGFADMWARRIFGRRDPGFTCCQDPDLLNFRSALDERIDYIYVRNDKGGELPFTLAVPLSARVIGDNIRDKTKTKPRLWPSDHGGVRATLIIPSLGNHY